MRRGDVVVVAAAGDYGKPRPAVIIQSARVARQTYISRHQRSNAMDTNNTIRKIVTAGLGEIPVVGGLVGGIAGAFWPKNTEREGIIRQLEATIEQRLSDAILQNLRRRLDGLSAVVRDYNLALRDSAANPQYISEKYNVAVGLLEVSLPDFQSDGYELPLLPLFTQFANLHLALLRDGAKFGDSWGWTPKVVDDEREKLDVAIVKYSDWASGWSTQYLLGTLRDQREQFGAKREICFGVMDHVFYWKYFGINAGPPPPLTRVIYSDMYGIIKGWFLPGVDLDKGISGGGRLTSLRIFGSDRITGAQWAFGNSPLGELFGHDDDGRATSQPPHGWNGNIDPSNPIVAVSGTFGSPGGFKYFLEQWIFTLQFHFKDGNSTPIFGNLDSDGFAFNWQFDGHILSEIFGFDEMCSDGYGIDHGAPSLFFGFRYEDSY
jgi:hypothetical protein